MDYTSEWNKSYMRKENFIFQPKEEVVKFLNRYIRKQSGAGTFIDILGSDLKGLDLGCGIGRQTILLSEFGAESYGIDTSRVAIAEARRLAQYHNKSARFQIIAAAKIPFDSGFFDFAIADSVFDSMPFKDACEYMTELYRTVKNLIYVNLISGMDDREMQVENEHEKGTIQSYFTEDKIKMLITRTNWKIVELKCIIEKGIINADSHSRYHIVLKK